MSFEEKVGILIRICTGRVLSETQFSLPKVDSKDDNHFRKGRKIVFKVICTKNHRTRIATRTYSIQLRLICSVHRIDIGATFGNHVQAFLSHIFMVSICYALNIVGNICFLIVWLVH